MTGTDQRAAQPNRAATRRSEGKWAPCRLCGARAELWATKRLLDRYDVDYFLCPGCGSVETEKPYWLAEAYDVSGVGDDIGAGQRTIDLVLKTTALLDRIQLPERAECIDFGGGLGLFTRLMRDRGFNFYSYDLYAKPFFSDRFCVASMAERAPAVVTAFEVLEHFADPARDVRQLFEGRPAFVIATTELFTGQDASWEYLHPAGGQHVFFYSRRAIDSIARQFGYWTALIDGLLVFVAPSELGRLGIAPNHVAGTLRALSQNGLLMRHALALFADHQRDGFKHVQRDFEATSRPRPR